MKITEIRVTPVNIRLDAPFYWSAGLYPGTSKVVVEVETDQGLTGLGEAPSTDCAGLIRDELQPRLLGRDALDINGNEKVCVPEWKVVQNTDTNLVIKAWGAVEMALWDLRGKCWEKPLYLILGGPVRKEIPFTEYFAFRPKWGGAGGELSPEAVVDHCLGMREEHGSTFFEGKLTLGDPELEIRTVRLLREALGEKVMLRLDSNMAWSLPTARRILREIEPFNIRNYEDPVATFEEMAVLRRHSAIPFSSHVPDIRRAMALGVPDAFVTNFTVLGGINRALRFIGACEAMGLDFWCYSGDAGICTAAYLHVVAATQWIREPSQSLFRWQIDDVIQDGPFRQTNNVIPVPEGPGLGVVLDRARMAACHQHFLENGPLDHFMEADGPAKCYRRLPRD